MEKTDDLFSTFGIISEEREHEKEVKQIQNNINILDESINDPMNDLKSPGKILQDYTEMENSIDLLQDEIKRYKESYADVFKHVEDIEERIRDLRTMQEDLKPDLTDAIKNSGLKKLENKRFKVTFVAATTRETFDKDKFKKKYPVLFKEFIKVSDVKEYIKISEVK